MAIKLDVTFNGQSLDTKFNIGLLSYEIQSASSRKVRGMDIPGRDGTYKVNSAFSSKKITLSVVVQGATPQEVHNKVRTFLTWLAQQDEPKVVFTDNPDVFVKADLDSASEYYVTRGIDNAMTCFTIELFQYDPFTYASEPTLYSFEAVPGRLYTLMNDGMYVPYNLYISSSESALVQYIATSVGHSTLSTSGVITNIIVEINGVRQMYGGILGADEVLKVNGADLVITKDGINVITDWSGNIEDLINGTNTFTMNNSENEKLFVTLEYHRRWL